MATPHEHSWETTNIPWSMTGQTWHKEGQWLYCPTCGRWQYRVDDVLQGRYFQNQEDANRAADELEQQMYRAKQEWLAVHYPEAVAGESRGRV